MFDVKFLTLDINNYANYNIGLTFFNNEVNPSFVFPLSYLDETKLTSKELKNEAKYLLLTINKIRKEFSYFGNNNKFNAFYSMIYLINDYINNGIYREKENKYTKNKGNKIEWKKTLKSNSFFLTTTKIKGNSNINLIYKDLIFKNSNLNENNILSTIYKVCLKISLNSLGFLFSISINNSDLFSDTKTNSLLENEKKYYLYYLNNEMNKTFNDYKKTLLKHLITIISSFDNINDIKNINNLLVSNEAEFEYIFERMNDKVFSNAHASSFYNEYFYYINNKNLASSSLRPDSILIDDINRTIYIIDSKYYKYYYFYNANKQTNIWELPPSSSIAKQIGYNHYLRNNYLNEELKEYKVRSVFILPFKKGETNDEVLKYIGYAYVKSVKTKSKKDYIPIILIDLKTLVHSYLRLDNSLSSKTLSPLLKTIFLNLEEN